MKTSYLYTIIGLLFISSCAFAEECSAESGSCKSAGEPAFSTYTTTRSVAEAAPGFGCVATINISIIPGTGRFLVIDGVNRPAADYQVSLRNTAFCVISGADIQITVPSGGFILSTNNLNPAASGQEGAYELVINNNGFGQIAPGSTYENASFTAYFLSSGVAQEFEATIVSKCSDCNVPAVPSAGCRAETLVSLRPGSTGVNSTTGKNYGVYDVLIINIGACGIYEVGLDFSLPPGITISQTTGLVQTYGVGQYKATGFRNTQGLFQGDTLPIENRYSASLIAEFDGTPIQKFTVDSTSFCGSSCGQNFSTPAPAQGSCSVVATATFIPGSPRIVPVDGTNRIVADYEVFVANYGSCPVSSVVITFNPYSGGSLTNATNLQPTGQPNQYTLSFTTELNTLGSTYNKASISGVYQSSGFAREVPISSVTPQCGGDCSSDSGSSSESRETACSSSAVAVLRTTWKSGSTENRLYDFIITNTGTSPAKSSDISLTFSTQSTISQSWNVQKVSDTVLRSNLFTAAPGSVVRSSGYVLTVEESVFSNGFTDPTVSVTSTEC
eukprot:TRINITY_DN73_c0_g2_i1.p1 TRINITY_DN73_c0_g2~~TRINITY_DN73_c0_g2_i1.p1  ORF type:complete len:557 (+),score=167.42 TRINITY_DN73_c0_g2_i1:134-1804(+)